MTQQQNHHHDDDIIPPLSSPTESNTAISWMHFQQSEAYSAEILQLRSQKLQQQQQQGEESSGENGRDGILRSQLRSQFASLFQELNSAVYHGKDSPHLAEILYWRCFMLREYINVFSENKDSTMPLQQIRSHWMKIILDCSRALSQKDSPMDPLMLRKLRGEACMKLGSLDKAKQDLLFCVELSQKRMAENQGNVAFFDMEAAELLQEVVNRLTERANKEMASLQKKMSSLEVKKKEVATKTKKSSLQKPVEKIASKPVEKKQTDVTQNDASTNELQKSSPSELATNQSTINCFSNTTIPNHIRIRQQHAISHPPNSNEVFFHGGYNNLDEELGDVVAYNLHTRKWRIVFDPQTEQDSDEQLTPSARYAHSFTWCTSESCFFMHGGRTEDGANSELWRFQEASGWTRLKDAPESLFGHLCICTGDELVFLFGQQGKDDYSQLVKVYSIKSNSWTTRSVEGAFPSPRVFSSGCRWGTDKYVVLGGLCATGDLLNDLWVCQDATSGGWTKWSRIEIQNEVFGRGIYNHSICIQGKGSLYCMGRYGDAHLYELNLESIEEKESVNSLSWVGHLIHSKSGVDKVLREGHSLLESPEDGSLLVLFGQDEENRYPHEQFLLSNKTTVSQ